MNSFPSEFSDLLNPEWKNRLGRTNGFVASLRKSRAKYQSFKVLSTETARACANLLTRTMDDCVQPLFARIPADSISKMRSSYSEELPKTMHMATAYLGRRGGKGFKAVKNIGLWEMFNSRSFKNFAELLSGYPLTDLTYQVICYKHGDHVGPHNDHHPETKELRDGYIDLHITLTNEYVDHQWLVWERRGFLSQILNINTPGNVGIYKLPFWHYTTPLVGKSGYEDKARRWLLLVSAQIV
ncbi:MAG TPA: hypothetical protein VI685_06260 [Candidatus Angelobacter sp.]